MDKTFLRACRGEATEYTPIWLNRQAGRYMPEYHAVKGRMPSLAFFKNPELAAQATLDAQRILGVDAAILFADLLPILEPMGLALDYKAGEGPVFANPLRSAADVAALVTAPAEESTPYIAETVRNVLSGLPAPVALIGFAGAPFTLASYAIEGKGSRNYVHVKRMMYEAPAVWDALMTKLVWQVASYLELQIAAGVEAVQLFDTWAGILSARNYRRFALPAVQRVFAALADLPVPKIYFAQDAAAFFPILREVGADVLGVDWRMELNDARAILGSPSVTLQGNMEPATLYAPPAVIEQEAARILASGRGGGHIFNLGHGILPDVPVDSVYALVEAVHRHGTVQQG
jgi:uroporphyrinogen decarboxylase